MESLSTIAGSASLTSRPVHRNNAWRWVFPAGWIIILLTPGWVFVGERGGWSWFAELEADRVTGALFPLVGLYAFTLVWVQVMLGSLMPLWAKFFPSIQRFHRAEGLFALLFALTHPTLLLLTVGWESYWVRDFVAPSQVKFLYAGGIALFTMLVTVAAALLMRRRWIARWWRKIHALNYALFGLVWIHSYFLGTDVQSTGLRYLWYGFAAAVVGALIYKNSKKGRTALYDAVD